MEQAPAVEPLAARAWTSDATSAQFHASAVAFEGRAALILGPSGSGKSSLALDLMARGADLIADDLCLVRRENATVLVSAPPNAVSAIEARGVGLIHADLSPAAPLSLVVDLSRSEPDRLPPRRQVAIFGQTIPLILGQNTPTLAAATLLLLRSGFARR